MKHNIWQIISAVVGLTSFGWGLYQYTQRSYENQISAATITKQVEQIVGLTKEINALAEINKILDNKNDSLSVQIDASRKLTDTHRRDARLLRIDIENLKAQLNETIILDLTDDEHWQYFLEWTNQ